MSPIVPFVKSTKTGKKVTPQTIPLEGTAGGRTWPRSVKVGSVTVKVYRMAHRSNRSGWAYVVAWTGTQGRQRQKFADQGDALEEARTKAAQLAAGRVEGAEMSRGDRGELQAARKLSGAVPVLAALAEWVKARELTAGNVITAAEAWAARNGQSFQRVKVLDAAKEYLKAKTKAGKNIATDHASIFESIKADLGDYSLDAVSAKQLDAWLAKRENPVSRNTYRKRIVALWRWAQRKGYLSRDVRTEAEMTDRAHEPAPVIGIINVATWEKLLRYFSEHHADYLAPLVVAGFAGLRRAEVHAQTWEDIALDRKNLRVSKGKRGTPARRMVPLCDAAVEWLMLCRNRKGALCDDLAIDRIRLLAREAKFELPDNCFRHSYISHRVAATGDIARVSLDAGNSPKEINRHYRELVSEDEGKAWFAVRPTAAGEIIPIGKAAS